MIAVTYNFEFNYSLLSLGRFPMLQLRVVSMNDANQAVDVDAFLDSGAEQSLFDGEIAPSIGLDLVSGRAKRYQSTSGATIDARLHRVRLSHEVLGNFELEVGFSLARISRNLLGRDFFDHVQIGFRERRLAFYVTPTP